MWPNQMDRMIIEQRRLELIAAAGRERAVREALGERGGRADALVNVPIPSARHITGVH
jgi:hypothetical protein